MQERRIIQSNTLIIDGEVGKVRFATEQIINSGRFEPIELSEFWMNKLGFKQVCLEQDLQYWICNHLDRTPITSNWLHRGKGQRIYVVHPLTHEKLFHVHEVQNINSALFFIPLEASFSGLEGVDIDPEKFESIVCPDSNYEDINMSKKYAFVQPVRDKIQFGKSMLENIYDSEIRSLVKRVIDVTSKSNSISRVGVEFPRSSAIPNLYLICKWVGDYLHFEIAGMNSSTVCDSIFPSKPDIVIS